MTKEERGKKIRERIQMGKAVTSYNNVPLAIEQLSDRNMRVAVYARVAAPAPGQISSYDHQTDYFMRLIGEHANWTMVDIYKDEGYFRNRKELSRMIEDCKAGKIDVIFTRSVSRLSRNTDELIQIINTLRSLDPPVGILFEIENIYTLDNPKWKKIGDRLVLTEG